MLPSYIRLGTDLDPGPAVYTVAALGNLTPDPASAIPLPPHNPAAHPPAADPLTRPA